MFNDTENSRETVCPIYYENHFYGGAMPQITTFTNIDFGDIRVVYLNSMPYFCLRDVCTALEFEDVDASMRNILRELDNFATLTANQGSKNPNEYYIPAYYSIPTKVTRQNKLRNGNIVPVTATYDMNYIDEPSLYRVIFKSKKPQAVEFQNWVYRDILPKMRQIGRENTEKLLNSQIESLKNDLINSINSIKINNDHELVNIVKGVMHSTIAPNTYLGKTISNTLMENGSLKATNIALNQNLSDKNYELEFKVNKLLNDIALISNNLSRLINILYNNGYIAKDLPVMDVNGIIE